MNPVSLIHVVFCVTPKWPHQLLSTCFAALDCTIDLLPRSPTELEMIIGIWEAKLSSQIEILLHIDLVFKQGSLSTWEFWTWHPLNTSQRVHHLSCGQFWWPSSPCTWWTHPLRTIYPTVWTWFGTTPWLVNTKMLGKNQRGALLKLQASYCLAMAKWSPLRHSSCNHCGTCKRPPFLGSQSRRSFCLSAFSSWWFEEARGLRTYKNDGGFLIYYKFGWQV